MLPSVRKRLRVVVAELMSIMSDCDLLNYERDKLNHAAIDIACADIYLSHLGVSHSKARELNFY